MFRSRSKAALHLWQLVRVGDRHQAVCRHPECTEPLSEPCGRGLAAAAGIVHWREHQDDAA
jgi:hypothetical protein